MGIPGATQLGRRAASAGKRVLLAEPRGYCAGVDRAVETVERALEKHGAPVYVRHEIVHNRHVVETLAKAGAVFVEETDEVPEGAIVVFSAHGVAPTVHATAAERNLQIIDATCPLVTKVHNEAKRFARDDYDILLIGHEGHEEVVGTAGEAPDHVQLVDGPDAVDNVTVRDEDKVIWLSQTTLSRRRDDGDRASGCGNASRSCRIRPATTSATPPRTVRSRSRRWRRSASW